MKGSSSPTTLLSYVGIFLIGVSLVVLGFIFPLSPCQLSETQVRKDLDSARASSLLAQSDIHRLTGKQHAHVVGFSLALKDALDAFNQQQRTLYGLTQAHLRALCPASYPLQWRLAHFEAIEKAPLPKHVREFQKKALLKYGAWMSNKNYVSKNALLKDLQLVANNVNTYAIDDAIGLADYQIYHLVYVWTLASIQSPVKAYPLSFFLGIFGLMLTGAVCYLIARRRQYGLPGIRNNHTYHNPIKNRRFIGTLTALTLIVLYIALYFYPAWITPWIPLFDPLSWALSQQPASPFFCYGTLYTLAIWIMGARMAIRYRHSYYHLLRTASLILCQTGFAYLIPELLVRLNKPYFDFKNIWPLDYDFFFDTQLNTLISSGHVGLFMLGWGIGLIVLGVPILTYFFGKRWYCSWVCGCGGLAETMGDPYRHLSNKSLRAWQFERWSVHGVLVLAVLMTAAVLWTYWTNERTLMGMDSYQLRHWYGALIGAVFAGVVGTGFYPWMGARVWCRFGCPLAAYLGLIQRFKSRFRITTNHAQCISCGNCSTYCEMGIDVRWYAQRNQDIVRASCVGCGVCASVCPRGVLKLENSSEKRRLNSAQTHL